MSKEAQNPKKLVQWHMFSYLVYLAHIQAQTLTHTQTQAQTYVHSNTDRHTS